MFPKLLAKEPKQKCCYGMALSSAQLLLLEIYVTRGFFICGKKCVYRMRNCTLLQRPVISIESDSCLSVLLRGPNLSHAICCAEEALSRAAFKPLVLSSLCEIYPFSKLAGT